MEASTANNKALSWVENTLLQENVGLYVDSIKKTLADSRIGSLLVEEHAITPFQLKRALKIQQEERGALGKILVRMGAADEEDINRVLNAQKIRRFQSLSTFLLGKLRLGQILITNRVITGRQLTEALKTQKASKQPLGEILVEMKVISRTTLQTFLKIQKRIKKIVVMSSLALVLGGCATTDMSVKGIHGKGISGTGKHVNHQSYDYQGKPAAVTPYESKYKRVRDYLKTASRFRYKRDKKGADYWQLPEETEKLGTGDCEDKAIWLYSKLLKDGFEDVRLVIGKEKENSRIFHSWVAWYPQGKVYILDPANDSQMWELRKYPKGYYKPYYSFYRDKSWRHT